MTMLRDSLVAEARPISVATGVRFMPSGLRISAAVPATGPPARIATLSPGPATAAITAPSTYSAPHAATYPAAVRLVLGEAELMSRKICPGFR